MPLVNVGLRHLIVFVEKCLKTPKLFLYYPLNITSMHGHTGRQSRNRSLNEIYKGKKYQNKKKSPTTDNF